MATTERRALLGDEPRAFDEKGPSFINDLGFSFEIDDDLHHAHGTMSLGEHVVTPSGTRPRLSVLATVTDVMIGVPTCATTLPDVPVTVDISIRLLAVPTTDSLRVEIELLKLGRSITTGEMRFTEYEGGPLVATGFMTFALTRNPDASAPPPSKAVRTTGSMTQPFPAHVGVWTNADGTVQMRNGPHLGNAMGGLQGGLVALLGEVAAEQHAGRDVVELDIRYLHSIAVGPGRASAVGLADDVCRVEIRDPGTRDRVCALVHARVAEPA